MTLYVAAAVPSSPVVAVEPHDHDWRLRDIEYDGGAPVRRFECDHCGDVSHH